MKFRLYIITYGLLAMVFSKCTYLPFKPAQYPSVSTLPVSVLNIDSVSCSGLVTNDGGTQVTSRGLCWGTSPNPTLENDPSIIIGNGIGQYATVINNLSLDSEYYIRSWATNSVGISYGNQVTFSTSYTLGQSFGGGTIYYIDNTKQHGLIAATSDLSAGIQWYNGNYVATNAIGDGMGTGSSNTQKIIAAQGSGSYAAMLCKSYKSGGFSDWYLPSATELSILLNPSNTITGLTSNYYWSSTESDTYDAYYVYNYSVYYSSYTYTDDKSVEYAVRPIRSF